METLRDTAFGIKVTVILFDHEDVITASNETPGMPYSLLEKD